MEGARKSNLLINWKWCEVWNHKTAEGCKEILCYVHATSADGDDARISMGSGIAYNASYRDLAQAWLLGVTYLPRGASVVREVLLNKTSPTNHTIGNRSEQFT